MSFSRRVFIFCTTSTVLLSLSPRLHVVYGQSPSGSMPIRDARITKVQERITKVMAQVTKAEERKDMIEGTLRERQQMALERIKTRIQQLDAIWARVQSRMEKMKTNGADLSSLDKKIAEVATKKQALTDVITSIETLINADPTPTIARKGVRAQTAAILPAIKAYHQSILTVITGLIGIQRTDKHLIISPTPAISVTPGA